MKEINELALPDDCRYTEDHEWARMEDGNCVIGIDDYAQDQLGDIVFVELPEVGSTFEAGEEFGSLESVKAVSELYIPLSGEIMAINDALEDGPEMVNEDPYGSGWMIKVKPSGSGQIEALMTKESYLQMLQPG